MEKLKEATRDSGDPAATSVAPSSADGETCAGKCITRSQRGGKSRSQKGRQQKVRTIYA